MLISASQIVVLAMGIVVSALSLWGLFVPDKMMKLVTGIMDRDWGIHFAVVVRLFLGAALIIAAPRSRFPAIFEIIGWIAIVAAVGIVFMGRGRLQRFVAWFHRLSPAMIRTWLLFGIAFGAFLVYGIL
jgi:hypothetical protein